MNVKIGSYSFLPGGILYRQENFRSETLLSLLLLHIVCCTFGTTFPGT